MSYELTGKTLRLAFDGSGELILKIKDQTSLELINLSETPCTAPYICMKADDSVYLLFISPEERCMIFVLDAGQNLVTCVTLYQSGDKRAEAEFKFGTIAREEAGHTEKKHGFSDNLWGNRMRWAFGGNLSFIHSYEPGGICRITAENGQTAIMDADAVKIGQALYLLLARGSGPSGVFARTSCYLINFNRATAVGLALGPDMKPEPFGAIGQFE
jgi:hypothetical protein